MSDFIEYICNNGYIGKMYGESSLSIIEAVSGKEVFHTGARNCNSLEDLKKLVEEYPKFLTALSRMKEVE